jgi:hypothetical protein
MPTSEDDPDELIWWWVPGVGAVVDFFDLPDDATHWMPWTDTAPPDGPNDRTLPASTKS